MFKCIFFWPQIMILIWISNIIVEYEVGLYRREKKNYKENSENRKTQFEKI